MVGISTKSIDYLDIYLHLLEDYYRLVVVSIESLGCLKSPIHAGASVRLLACVRRGLRVSAINPNRLVPE